LDKVAENIKNKYSSQSRKYHGTDHIAKMLINFDKFMEESSEAVKITNPDEFKFAIFMHDYINGVKNDVSKSAKKAADMLKTINAEYDTSYVENLINATNYSVPVEKLNYEQKVMRDLDISILGSNVEEYKNYSKLIREEYKDVPNEKYKAERQKLLLSFMKTYPMFKTDYFIKKFENAARVNVSNELGALIHM